MAQYEVRYLVNGEEHQDVFEADSAAHAAESIRQANTTQDDAFELIQVSPQDLPEEEQPDTASESR